MGWKNPGSTATAVDTGRGLADAGVRLFQDLSNPSVPQGVAEWRTGLMDRNAQVRLSGGGSGGSAFTIDGGATVGVDAPYLGLDVASAPLGGYVPSAYIGHVGALGLPDDPGWAAYTCAQHAQTAAPSDPAGSLVARYKSSGTRTDFQIWHRPGTGYNGGSGGYYYDLPWAAVTRQVGGVTTEQFVLCRGYTSDGSQWVGWGYIPAGASIVYPYLPRSASDCRLANAQDVTAGQGVTSGIPNITSNYPFLGNASNLFIGGTYETATPHV